MSKKRVSFKQITKNFFSEASTHGLSRIVKENDYPVFKFTWMLLVLVGLGLVVYLIAVNVISYFAFEYYYTSSMKTDDQNTFPAVTFCNLYPANYKNNGDVFRNILSQMKTKNDTSDVSIIGETVSVKSGYLKANMLSNSLTMSRTALKSLGFDFKEMVMSCSFNGIFCEESDFSYSYSYQYGNCYTFNKKNASTELKTLDSAGPSFGLKMELYAGPPQIQDENSMSAGFYVAVHNNSENLLTNYKGNFIQLGAETYIGVTKQVIQRLPHPYTNCTDQFDNNTISADHEILSAAIQDMDYEYRGCEELCKQKYFYYPNCSCQYAGFRLLDGLRICTEMTEINCARQKVRTLKQGDVNDVCKAICPTKCTSHNYVASLSSTSYPTKYYADQLANTTFLNGSSYMEMRGTLAMFKVYFNLIEYENIEQVPNWLFLNLLSSIGGYLGLFIGMSLLSVFEVIEYIIRLVINRSHGKIDIQIN